MIAIGFVWLGCAVAWVTLGSTIVARTGESSSALNSEVQQLWGPPLVQQPPRAVWKEIVRRKERMTSYGPQGQLIEQMVEKEVDVEHPIALVRSEVRASLEQRDRKKGLLWFPTYDIDFRAGYGFVNDTPEERDIVIHFPLAAGSAVFDGFAIEQADGQPISSTVAGGDATLVAKMKSGARRDIVVRYRSRGTGKFGYALTAGTGRVQDFSLALDTNVAAVDFEAGSLSPSLHAARGPGWHGEWRFASLVASQPIGVVLPQRLNPGPVAARITFFAPVGLLFFFFVVASFAAVRGVSLHPFNYFLIGAGFFAFHLLLAYLADHLPVYASFTLAALASIFLVVSYARWFVGWRFAMREIGLAQLVYLVLFSASFFIEGFTGLAISVGAVITLFVIMQISGRSRLVDQ